MLILVINCGSSSAKYELINVKDETTICKGIVERICEDSPSCRNHAEAVGIIRDILIDPEKGVIKSLDEVSGIGHRVVHGGEEFHESTLITGEVISSIEKFSELAPLHNPPALEGIRACLKIFGSVPQVAVFDTAFHQGMPEHAYFYGIPYEYYEKYRIRRYGFHGTSHRYVSIRAAELLKKPLKDIRLVTVHLGNGCSISAVSGGKSVETSMGFTPLEGLLMGTRSGNIDPTVAAFLMQREGMDIDQVLSVLNKESGLLGVSGVSNDMRDILKAVSGGNKRAKLAYDIFVYRIKKYVGSYAAVLGKVDAVIFTAGIGENVPQIKDEVEKSLSPLLGTGTRFMIIKTNEELLIAKDTYDVIKGRKNA